MRNFDICLSFSRMLCWHGVVEPPRDDRFRRRNVKWLATAVFCVGVTTMVAAQGSGPVRPDAQVLAASDAWAQALQKNDIDTIERLLADDFMSIQQTPEAVVSFGKAAQIESLKKTAATRPRLERQLSKTQVKMLGEVAILTAGATFKGTDASGAPLSTQGVIMEVWVRQNGTWRLTHFQPVNVLRRVNPAPPAR
jgi:ketosteroid isomerase-like protein